MRPKKRIFISIIILVVLIVAFYFVTYEVTRLTGHIISGQSQTGDFEKCLEKQNITLYINSADTDATLKRTGLIDYMQYFKIQNCIKNSKPCIDNNIDEFPTWIINKKKITGEITISELATDANCNIV
jgi:hypothetical protein